MSVIKNSVDCKGCPRKKRQMSKVRINQPDNRPAPLLRYPAKKTSCKRSASMFFHVSVSILIWAIIVIGILHYKKISPKDIHMEGFLAKMKEMSDRFFRSFVTIK
ncbi:uncharacterized protein ACN427_010411 [Glossina fuscipes fuscipes]